MREHSSLGSMEPAEPVGGVPGLASTLTRARPDAGCTASRAPSTRAKRGCPAAADSDRQAKAVAGLVLQALYVLGLIPALWFIAALIAA
jgi:hypothetical protein